jgi:hypothetical protein
MLFRSTIAVFGATPAFSREFKNPSASLGVTGVMGFLCLIRKVGQEEFDGMLIAFNVAASSAP